jgi:guanosine-diphosphatase
VNATGTGQFTSNSHLSIPADFLIFSAHPLSDPGEPHDSGKGFRSTARAKLAGRMFSGRNSGGYDRLEGGHGPGRQVAGRGFAWKKFAIGAAALITLVYLFGPRETPGVFGGKKSQCAFVSCPVDVFTHECFSPRPALPNDDYYDIITTPHGDSHHPTPPNNVEPGPDKAHPPPPQPDTDTGDKELSTFKPPTSPEDDPDLSKTVQCTTPYKPNLPLVQYALMIDAGSQGSRIHIYKFNNCGPSAAYEYEVFKQLQPGLSYYKSSPQDAAESLDELLDEAVRVVPQDLWKCTPVALKATAGLRMLGEQQSKDILEAVANRIRDKYEFHLRSNEDVAIMDGKDEGVYAWITANYLLHAIGRSNVPSGNQRVPEKKTTFAVLDLGGASTQIVFEPAFDQEQPNSLLKDGEHKYDLTFGGEKRVLYQHSYLGYGLKQAREHVHKLVEFLAPEQKDPTQKRVIANPCLANGTRDDVTIGEGEDRRTISMDGTDVGSFEGCSRYLQLVMAKDA